MAANLKISWARWHRRLGLVTCFGVLLWGLSGLSHPIMTRLQPKPVAFSPPASMLDLKDSMTPSQVLACGGISRLQRFSAINIDDKVYYRIAEHADSPARYFSASNCSELRRGDEQYARLLASHYTGRPASDIVGARFINAFNDEYPAVSRLLPVWRIEFSGQDQLRAYIDTDQARLSTLVDNRRVWLSSWFHFGHNWGFLDGMPRGQLIVMALVLSATLFSAISGLTLYFRRLRHSKERLATQPCRRWHRRIGLLVSVSTLLFAGSGMFHLFMSYRQQQATPHYAVPDIQASAISAAGWNKVAEHAAGRVDLVLAEGEPYWLLRSTMPPAQVGVLAQDSHVHVHHAAKTAGDKPLLFAADGTSAVPDTDSLARRQAVFFANLPLEAITETALVSRFGGEYGFIFKRLPVVKVQFRAPGNPRYYIEPATGVLAAVVTDADATEGWSFAYLHKWVWLDFNKDLRDLLVMLFALGNVVVALLGVWLFSRRAG